MTDDQAIEAWVQKALADMPPMTADQCAAVARILDDIRIARADAAIAKRKKEQQT